MAPPERHSTRSGLIAIAKLSLVGRHPAGADLMRDRALLVVSLILVAFNLRPALSSVAPVLPEIMRDTGLSAAGAGLLTTAPVLCLGLFGPLAPVAARWMRSERVVLLFLAVLAVGLLLRGFGTVP